MATLSPHPRYQMSINGELLHYTRAGILIDHGSRRVRGTAITLDADDSFAQLLRNLRIGQVVRLVLSYGTTIESQSVVEYDGPAEVVMVRERISQKIVPSISFVFKLLGDVLTTKELRSA